MESGVGVLDDAAAAELAHSTVSVKGDCGAVLEAELLETPAEVGQGLQSPVRHEVARLEAQLAQIGAMPCQAGQATVPNLQCKTNSHC